MTTRSLILHPHEVRAALDGRLGLVVRPVKPQPFGGDATYQNLNIYGQHIFYPMSEDESVYDKDDGLRNCPLGAPGDRLVCKEAYRRADEGVPDGIFYPANALLRWFDGNEPLEASVQILGMPRNGVNRSPATMPAWASRITLEVVGVRVCRTYELTGKDAIACGFVPPSEAGQFKDAWNRNHAKRGFAWDSNPWVWAVEVRKVEG